jgi:hypothetical protein
MDKDSIELSAGPPLSLSSPPSPRSPNLRFQWSESASLDLPLSRDAADFHDINVDDGVADIKLLPSGMTDIEPGSMLHCDGLLCVEGASPLTPYHSITPPIPFALESEMSPKSASLLPSCAPFANENDLMLASQSWIRRADHKTFAIFDVCNVDTSVCNPDSHNGGDIGTQHLISSATEAANYPVFANCQPTRRQMKEETFQLVATAAFMQQSQDSLIQLEQIEHEQEEAKDRNQERWQEQYQGQEQLPQMLFSMPLHFLGQTSQSETQNELSNYDLAVSDLDASLGSTGFSVELRASVSGTIPIHSIAPAADFNDTAGVSDDITVSAVGLTVSAEMQTDLPKAASGNEDAVKNTRPWECDLCPSRFSIKGHLSQHKRYVHAKFRPHGCEVTGCAASFGTRFARSQHVWTVHLKRKPFICDVPGCKSTFGQRSHLNRHSKRHKSGGANDVKTE